MTGAMDGQPSSTLSLLGLSPHQMERVATEKSALEAALNQQEKKLEKLSLEVRTLHLRLARTLHMHRVCTCTVRALQEPGPLEACIVHRARTRTRTPCKLCMQAGFARR